MPTAANHQSVPSPASDAPGALSSHLVQDAGPAALAQSEGAEPVLEPSGRLPTTARNHIWGIPFDSLTLAESVTKIGELVCRRVPSYVITANLNYAMLNHRHREMHRVTQDASLILADGQPIVWRSKLAQRPLPERVTGSELIFQLAERASAEGWRIYFLGGAPGVAECCANSLQDRYPGLTVAGFESPPFRELTPSEQAQQDARIRDAGTDILLVALGQPKGELWIHQHYQRLGVPVSIQLGASFDFIAGTAKRAPAMWQGVGLEWAYRMLSDPKRLAPRYAANATFLAGALLADWKRLMYSWGRGRWAATEP